MANLTEIIVGPSGSTFVVREQNGADDDILSRMGVSTGNELSILHQFLAGILVSIDGIEPVTPLSVKSLGLRDKYAILIAARIFSLGNVMKFTYQWDPNLPPTEYQQDLTEYIWEYTKPFPEVGSSEYNSKRIEPYKQMDFMEVEVNNNRYRLKYIDGVGEEQLFDQKSVTINSILLARNIQIETSRGFEPIKNFKEVSSRDLAIIRGTVEKLDPIPSAEVSIENPFTGETQVIPLLAIRDFFFPTLV